MQQKRENWVDFAKGIGILLVVYGHVSRGVVNAVGLFILVAFLGYGLVEVPRELWNKGDTEGQLRYLKFKVAVQSDELQQVSAGRPHPRAARSHST